MWGYCVCFLAPWVAAVCLALKRSVAAIRMQHNPLGTLAVTWCLRPCVHSSGCAAPATKAYVDAPADTQCPAWAMYTHGVLYCPVSGTRGLGATLMVCACVQGTAGVAIRAQDGHHLACNLRSCTGTHTWCSAATEMLLHRAHWCMLACRGFLAQQCWS